MTLPPLPPFPSPTLPQNGGWARDITEDEWANWALDYAAAVRAATIEECAKVCEQSPGDRLPYGCAAAIRALKTQRVRD